MIDWVLVLDDEAKNIPCAGRTVTIGGNITG